MYNIFKIEKFMMFEKTFDEALNKSNFYHLFFTIARETNNKNLIKLFYTSKYSGLRESIARNKNISYNLLEKLSRDSSVIVKLAVAQNPKTPASVLKILLKEKYNQIVKSVMKNPNFKYVEYV